MFERYTERSRRVIFFARYEALQYGSPVIAPEHILLGLMREDKSIAARFFPFRNSLSEIMPEESTPTKAAKKGNAAYQAD